MRNEIDSKFYAGEIRMWKSARKEKSVAVIVEAKSDELFFQKFFNSSTTFFPVDGFQNAINVLQDVEKELLGILAIIDADFRHILKEEPASLNLFITDFHDVEMMTIAAKSWDEVISYHTQKTKLEKFQKQHSKSLKEYLMAMAHPIACIRFLNNQNNLGLSFKTMSKGQYIFLDYSKFIDKQRFCIDNEKLLETIENKSQKQNFFKNNPSLINELSNISQKEFNLFDFCNGHDVINMLSLALKKEIGNKNISGQELESFFIVAYRFDDFIQTHLYQELKKWEGRNPNLVLFNKDDPAETKKES